MTPDAETAVLHIYERWHETVVHRDLDGLTALYDDDAVFESPLVWAVRREAGTGILRGRAAIRDFFAAGFRAPETGLGRWYRTGTFFSDGRQLTWEYPRRTPDGDQVDLVEVMDLRGGLIAHHRVYWGWVGIRALSALPTQAPPLSPAGAASRP
ncbi:nuclear transport factor 2 family protein [Methylobacterium sp. ID0610]|uniref:nuclear transport factor 2 family protein n=1 Tax=Methylobacterium carpenticola TaxID=3344827 RepID=UPI0036C5250C